MLTSHLTFDTDIPPTSVAEELNSYIQAFDGLSQQLPQCLPPSHPQVDRLLTEIADVRQQMAVANPARTIPFARQTELIERAMALITEGSTLVATA